MAECSPPFIQNAQEDVQQAVHQAVHHGTCEITTPGGDQRTTTHTVVRKEPVYNVILLDDDEHTYEYVIEMLTHIFRHANSDAYKMAVEVDHAGRVIVESTHLERAELKRDQIMSFGCDPLLRSSPGSMQATIEPQQG